MNKYQKKRLWHFTLGMALGLLLSPGIGAGMFLSAAIFGIKEDQNDLH